MEKRKAPPTDHHAFIVRIWWEPDLTRPDGRALWRGKVQHTASGRSFAFQSLEELLRFIQSRTGTLGEEEKAGSAQDLTGGT